MHRRKEPQGQCQLLEWGGLEVEAHRVKEARHGIEVHRRGEDAEAVEALVRTLLEATQCIGMLQAFRICIGMKRNH